MLTDLDLNQRNATRGDTVILPCESMQSSGVKWMRNTSRGYGDVDLATSTPSRFTVTSPHRGQFDLEIYNLYRADTGEYDCYSNNGALLIRYYLLVKSTFVILQKGN